MAKNKKSAFAEYASSQTWETSEGFEKLPDFEDGILKLTSGEVRQSGSNFWMLELKWEILQCEDEDLVGKKPAIYLMFESAKGWNPFQVKNFFKQIEVELPDFEEMEDAISELVQSNLTVVASFVTKKEYQTMDISEVVDAPVEEKEEEKKSSTKKSKKKTEPEPEPEPEEKKSSKKKSKKKSDDTETKKKLIAFMENSGVEEVENMSVENTLEEMKAVLSEYEFEEDDCLEEEIELLKSVGLEDIIV
jgi:dGTP triphosphohydrolase